MAVAKKILLPIGLGNVGGAAVIKAQEELGLDIKNVVRSSGVYDFNRGHLVGTTEEFFEKWKKDKPDIVFVTLPSFEDGEEAYRYISFFLDLGVPVVTAEKGALANFYKKLEPKMDSLGISATVGGGTRMLPYVKERMSPAVNQVHMVVNGTLNFIIDGVAHGRTLGQVVDEAIKLGYAEPGALNPLDVINGEAVGDVPKKVSILFNSANFSDKKLDWRDVKQPPLTQEDLDTLITESKNRRFIVSMYRNDMATSYATDSIASFTQSIDGWTIIGGFQNILKNPLFDALDIPGPSNGAVIAAGKNEEDGVYYIVGPGAGPNPTAASMIQDARKLLEKKK